MSQSSSASAMKKGMAIGKYTVVVDLGHRAPPTYAVHASTLGGDPELVVLELVATSDAPAEANDSFVRRARRLAQARHPNIVRIRDVVVTKASVAVVTDFIEGETLAELLTLDAATGSKRFGLPELLRVLVDVLSGMSAIHLAPELVGGAGKNDSAPFHGAIHPRNIVVGADGSSRLIRVVRAPFASSNASERAIEAPGYAAPELLLGDVTAGPRVDIYSVGVLLWEALSASRLFSATEGNLSHTESNAKQIVERQLAGSLPRATPPADSEWANALVDIAARALEVDPDKRFLSTAELAGALRLAVQARLPPASRVGAAVTALAKEKIAERRTRLQPKPRAVKAAAPIETKGNPSHATNPPKITEQKPAVVLPSLVDDDPEHGPVTQRLKVESLHDEDLVLGEDDAIDARWSSAPPAKKPSIAPPLPKKASIAPPVPIAVAPPPPMLTPEPAPSPIQNLAVATPSSIEIETIAPAVAPSAPMTNAAPLEAPAFSAVAMQQSDASGAVIYPLEDPQRKRRKAIVLAFLGFSALILIIAGIRHVTAGSDDRIPTAASAKPSATAPIADPPPATAIATTTSPPIATVATTANPPPQPTSTAGAPDPFDESTLQKPATPKNDNSTPSPAHPTSSTNAKPPHKKPPHSNYEPEGI